MFSGFFQLRSVRKNWTLDENSLSTGSGWIKNEIHSFFSIVFFAIKSRTTKFFGVSEVCRDANVTTLLTVNVSLFDSNHGKSRAQIIRVLNRLQPNSFG